MWGAGLGRTLWPRSHSALGPSGGSMEQLAFELGLGQWVEMERGVMGEFLQTEGQHGCGVCSENRKV